MFRSKFYIKNNDGKLVNFDAWYHEGIFLGYSSKCKGYMCYNKGLHKISECIDVEVDEELPNKNRNIGSMNPPNHHHRSEENEILDEEA